MGELEAALLEQPNQYDFKSNTKHLFAHGTYTRELFIPAGVCITGKIHRFSTVNIICKGKIKVVTDEGSFEIEGPDSFVSGAGVKKAVYAIEDTVWINVLPWDGEKDLDLIEKHFTFDSYEALEMEKRKCLSEQ